MTERPPEAYYHWPTLRSKLWPITVLRVPMLWPWLRIDALGNWYHGNYWGATIGPWVILGGTVHLRDPEAGLAHDETALAGEGGADG